MTEVDILCLANSWKTGGRCVAGLRLDDGSWLRPVSDNESGELSHKQCMMDNGHAVKPLDVVRVYLEKPSPRPHQPEDWIIADRQWRFLEHRSVADVREFLGNASEEHATGIFGNEDDRLSWWLISNGSIRVQSSLTLLKVDTPEFRPKQKRAIFDHAGVTYDLAITFEDVPQVGGSSSKWYFTISLGEPFTTMRGGHPCDDCYKLIAGAIELPPK